MARQRRERITNYELEMVPDMVDTGLGILLRYYDDIDWIESSTERLSDGFELKVLFQICNGMATKEMIGHCFRVERRHVYNQLDRIVQRMLYGTDVECGINRERSY